MSIGRPTAESRATDPRFHRDQVAEEAKAWHLREKQHWQIWRIAQELGCSNDTASRRVRDAAKRFRLRDTLDPDDVVVKSASNLDRWSEDLEAAIKTGEVEMLPGVRQLLALNESLRKLVGADAIARIRVESVPASPSDDAPPPSMPTIEAFQREIDSHDLHADLHEERGDPKPPLCLDEGCELFAQARATVDKRADRRERRANEPDELKAYDS